LRDWLASHWIIEHEPNRDEVAELFAVIDRDMRDAALPRLSADWRLGISYNAALQLATLALAAEGYRPGRERAHERAILSLRHTVGISSKTVDVLDAVRRKRNQISIRARWDHLGPSGRGTPRDRRKAARGGGSLAQGASSGTGAAAGIAASLPKGSATEPATP